MTDVTISAAGPHGAVDATDRIPVSKGPFTPGTKGYHTVEDVSQFSLEGTFTPTFTFEVPGDVSVSYSIQGGAYRRVGNIVFFSLRITCTPTFTTASGVVRIGGFPLPAVLENVFSSANPGGAGWVDPAGVIQYAFLQSVGNTYGTILARGNGVNKAMRADDMISGSTFFMNVTGFYFV